MKISTVCVQHIELSSDVYLPFLTPPCLCSTTSTNQRTISRYSTPMYPPSPQYQIIPIKSQSIYSNSMPGLYNKSSHSLHTFGKNPSPSLDEMLSINNNNTEINADMNSINHPDNDRRKALYYYGDISTESMFDSRMMDIDFVDDNEQDKGHTGHFSNFRLSANRTNVDNVCGNLLINVTESFDNDV